MARIALAYPKMPDSRQAPLSRCVAFEKYDGTNMHWVWERELDWYAFGTRRDRFDLDELGIAEFTSAHPGLEEAAAVFQRELAEALTDIFSPHAFYGSSEIVVFTEFLGPNSFAGRHRTSDTKSLVLIDVHCAAGFLAP